MQELPAFQQVYAKYQGEADMLAVAIDEQGGPQQYFAEHGLTIPLVQDVDGKQAYGVKGIPRTLVFDAQGTLVKDFTGGIGSADLELALKAALGK